MIVKICTAASYGDNKAAASELEKSIQKTINKMAEDGFFLKQINYSSSCGTYSYYDDYNVIFEKSAALIFDRQKNF